MNFFSSLSEGPDWLGGAATAVTVGIIGGPPGQPEDGSAIVESYLSAMRQSRAEGREDWQRKVAESHRHQLDSSTVQHVRNVFASAQDTICSLPFEPTLGLMHVAEHVERTLPNIVEIQRAQNAFLDQIENATKDIEDAHAELTRWMDLQSPSRIFEDLRRAIKSKNEINRRAVLAAQQQQQLYQTRATVPSSSFSIATTTPATSSSFDGDVREQLQTPSTPHDIVRDAQSFVEAPTETPPPTRTSRAISETLTS